MVPNVAMVVMVAMVTTVAKVIMVAMVNMAHFNDIGLKNDVQRKVQDYHSKEECLIMQTNAGKWRRMMTSAVIKWVLVGSFVLQKAYDMLVRYLDDSQKDKKLPDNVCDVYSDKEYAKFCA